MARLQGCSGSYGSGRVGTTQPPSGLVTCRPLLPTGLERGVLVGLRRVRGMSTFPVMGGGGAGHPSCRGDLTGWWVHSLAWGPRGLGVWGGGLRSLLHLL